MKGITHDDLDAQDAELNTIRVQLKRLRDALKLIADQPRQWCTLEQSRDRYDQGLFRGHCATAEMARAALAPQPDEDQSGSRESATVQKGPR